MTLVLFKWKLHYISTDSKLGRELTSVQIVQGKYHSFFLIFYTKLGIHPGSRPLEEMGQKN